jgi:hypothetical protein
MNFRRLFCCAYFISLAGLSACGGGSSYSNNPTPPPPTPAPATPSVSSTSPSSATAGSAGFTLTVNGSNFTSGAQVKWSNPGNPGFVGGPATFVSASQLTLQISAADIAIPGSVQVTVTVPNIASASNAAAFVINPGPAGAARVISTGAMGAAPNGNSHDPVLSFNGRIVAFSSEATNLVVPNTIFAEGYMRDTCLGADNCLPLTLLISAETGGSVSSPVEGNGLGGATPSIGFQTFSPLSTASSAGRFFGFLSTATNLIAGGTVFQQAYFRDDCLPGLSQAGCNPATMLVSMTESGGEPDGPASEFAFSSNDCNAAFVSASTHVLNGVTTPPNEIYLSSCGIVAPFAFGFTTSGLVSASSSGVPGDQGGAQPAISSDGRFVAFASTSTNLTSTLSGGFRQVYSRDTCLNVPSGCTPSTTIVSVDSAGNALAGSSQFPAISDDGRFIVFTTQTPAVGGGVTIDVSIRDTCNSPSGPVAACVPSTTPISVTPSGGVANGPSSSGPHAVSGDGRFVVFSSSATNLIPAGNPAAQVFVRDTCKSSSVIVSVCTPITILISANSTGPIGGFNAAISDDGHFAAFVTTVGAVEEVFLAATGF